MNTKLFSIVPTPILFLVFLAKVNMDILSIVKVEILFLMNSYHALHYMFLQF